MIDFHYWPTPNGWKVSIMLEEWRSPLPHAAGEHRGGASSSNRTSSPSAPTTACRRSSITIRRSATPTPPKTRRTRSACSSPAPSSSNLRRERAGASCRRAHGRARRRSNGCSGRSGTSVRWPASSATFVNYDPPASTRTPTAATRTSTHRCLGVLERRLEKREFLLGDYSIADMAVWPWVLIARPLGQPLDEFPAVTRWRGAVKSRPAVRAGVDLGKDYRRSAPPDEAERGVLFGQRGRDA